jgi:anti-anti-sigma factor
MEELDTNETGFLVERSFDAAGCPLITLGGDLDISSADKFRAVVEEVVSEDPPGIVFDVAHLAFMDSTGIAVMVYAANKVGNVELRHASNIVRRVVEATGLTDVLKLDPS